MFYRYVTLYPIIVRHASKRGDSAWQCWPCTSTKLSTRFDACLSIMAWVGVQMGLRAWQRWRVFVEIPSTWIGCSTMISPSLSPSLNLQHHPLHERFTRSGGQFRRSQDFIVYGNYTRLYPIEAETASSPVWQYMIVQGFFRYRAEKTTDKKFETPWEASLQPHFTCQVNG